MNGMSVQVTVEERDHGPGWDCQVRQAFADRLATACIESPNGGT